MNGKSRTPTSWTTSSTADGWVTILPHQPLARATLIAATLCRVRVVTAARRAVVFRRSRRTWKFGENPARSRHCVSLGSSQTCLRRTSTTTGRRNPGGTDVRAHAPRAGHGRATVLLSRPGPALADLRQPAGPGRAVPRGRRGGRDRADRGQRHPRVDPRRPASARLPVPLGPGVLSVRSFLVRGLLAGLVAGFVAFGVAYATGEPSIEAAIAIEESAGGHAHAEGTGQAAAEDATGTQVPRSLQSTAGLLTATAVAGTTLGGLIGVLSALAVGRFGALGVRGTTLLVTGIGFVSLYVLPFVAYPPNPPAVGSAETIGTRTTLYLATVAISVVAAVVALLAGRRLATRAGAWWATLAGIGGYLLVVLGT